MKILIIEPDKAPRRAEIDGSLTAMQGVVGGLIQAISPFDADPTIALICHDEGKLMGLPLNRVLRDEDGRIYDVICGTFFLCAAPPDSDCFAGLSDEQLERYADFYRCPEFGDALL